MVYEIKEKSIIDRVNKYRASFKKDTESWTITNGCLYIANNHGHIFRQLRVKIKSSSSLDLNGKEVPGFTVFTGNIENYFEHSQNGLFSGNVTDGKTDVFYQLNTDHVQANKWSTFE